MIARRLSRDDVVGIVSPSFAVTKDYEGQLEAGLKVLKSFGLHPRLGKYVRSATLGFAATPEEKARDINGMFADSEVKAIICSQGGDSANACLDYIDWEGVCANPKIFLGISDITVLLNAITRRTGLITFHGNDVMWGFGRETTPYDLEEFRSCFFDAGTGPVKPAGERKTIRKGRAEGILLGGNLRCLMKLAGTPYFPDFTNSILFFESLDITAEGCHALFHQLKQAGGFHRARGAIVGYVEGMQKRNDPVRMEDVLLQVTSGLDFPILKTNDFGHNCPNTVLPVGGKILLDADNHVIEIKEPCLK
ncbi:MAG: LD-carboxypeptidase [Spirochaetales bacterium]|nr:LD-carboxypeptidase [Spirochaetales bacterium]